MADLESCGRDEVGRIAQDFGLPASDLRAPVSHGPGEGNLLQRRMAALHLDVDELARSEPATLRDLQRVCTTCGSTLDALTEEKAIDRLNRCEEKRKPACATM